MKRSMEAPRNTLKNEDRDMKLGAVVFDAGQEVEEIIQELQRSGCSEASFHGRKIGESHLIARGLVLMVYIEVNSKRMLGEVGKGSDPGSGLTFVRTTRRDDRPKSRSATWRACSRGIGEVTFWDSVLQERRGSRRSYSSTSGERIFVRDGARCVELLASHYPAVPLKNELPIKTNTITRLCTLVSFSGSHEPAIRSPMIGDCGELRDGSCTWWVLDFVGCLLRIFEDDAIPLRNMHSWRHCVGESVLQTGELLVQSVPARSNRQIRIHLCSDSGFGVQRT